MAYEFCYPLSFSVQIEVVSISAICIPCLTEGRCIPQFFFTANLNRRHL
jgi:hypothetical protein